MGVASGCGYQEVGVASGSGWNLWVWLMGGMYGCGYQEVGVVGRRQVECMGVVIRRWVWLETIGVVSGCFPHITYISLLHLFLLFFAAASLLLFSFC